MNNNNLCKDFYKQWLELNTLIKKTLGNSQFLDSKIILREAELRSKLKESCVDALSLSAADRFEINKE